MNNIQGTAATAKLSQRHVLSVRCPMCRAKAKEPCTLTTGHPSEKTHLAREQAASKVARPDNSGQAAMRMLGNAARRGFDGLFTKRKH
jgi:hypothetical protein